MHHKIAFLAALALSASDKEHETKALYGLGAACIPSKTLNLRTEFRKPTSDTKVTTIGLRLSF